MEDEDFKLVVVSMIVLFILAFLFNSLFGPNND